MLVTLRVYRVKTKLSHESLLGGYTDGSDGLVAVTGFFSKALVRAIRCQCYSFLNSIFLSSSNRLKNQQTETPWLTPWQRIGRICYSRKKETKQCKYREVFFSCAFFMARLQFKPGCFCSTETGLTLGHSVPRSQNALLQNTVMRNWTPCRFGRDLLYQSTTHF